MSKKKKESRILAPLLKKLAPRVGARVFVEPRWGIVGQITFKSGKHSFFRYNTLDLNPVGSADVAKDKDYAALFMKKMGYPVPSGKAFFSNEWAIAIGSRDNAAAAEVYARKRGLPLIVKPNSGSQGADVELVHTTKDLHRALANVFRHDRVALIQKPLRGRDYRIVVLDNQIISAYERVPLNVTGDGRSTVEELLAAKQKQFDISNRDTQIKILDPRIKNKLKRQKLTFNSVLERGIRIPLLDTANLSTGGDSIDVTDTVHAGFKKLAIKLTRDMGLRLCGVDIMVDGDITQSPTKFCILEINAAPGLDHYVKTGPKQRKIVEQLYLRVLKSLDR